MCLAVPMQLVGRDGAEGVAVLSGVRRRVLLDLCPEAQVGEYVIVHAGYAIQRLDEAEARETLELLAELASAGDLNLTEAAPPEDPAGR
jgi:hydrogenase expression/formation protein HypC